MTGIGKSVSCVDVSRIYGKGENGTEALTSVTADFPAGELTSIMGASGSGKSTLLHILAGLDEPSAGSVSINGHELNLMGRKERLMLRRDEVGFVFQSHNLIPVLTARENMTLTCDLSGTKYDEAWFYRIVDTMGISDRLDHYPDQLSGGQRQKIAVARVLLQKPSLVFADEPTGSIDSRNSTAIMKLLREECVERLGMTVIMVTHDASDAAYADTCLILNDGRLIHTIPDPNENTINTIMGNMKTTASTVDNAHTAHNADSERMDTDDRTVDNAHNADSVHMGTSVHGD